MHTAIWGKNVVCERFQSLSEGIVILESDFYASVANLFVYVKNVIREEFLAVIEAFDITLDATLKVKGFVITSTLICDGDENTFREIRLVTCIIGHPSVVKGSSLFEDAWIWIECNRGTMFAW